MHKRLIIEAFDKARIDLQLEGIIDPSVNQMSLRISDFLTNEFKAPMGERSLSDYYRKALSDDKNVSNISIAQLKVIEGLCSYLGYADYPEYVLLNDKSKQTLKTTVNSSRKSRLKSKTVIIFISIGLLLIFGTLAILNNTKQEWMVWQEDHYEEVPFDSHLLSSGKLKLYKEERILNFKKVKNPDCTYGYFNEDGSVNSWYGKNKQGELEIFTDIGLHPETGKSLKPITKYIIKKYLCPNY